MRLLLFYCLLLAFLQSPSVGNKNQPASDEVHNRSRNSAGCSINIENQENCSVEQKENAKNEAHDIQKVPTWTPWPINWDVPQATIIIGSVGAFIGLATLGILYFQTRTLRQQVTAMMDADCALILILWQNMIHIDPEAPNGVLHHCFQWTFQNVGKNPAFIKEVHSRFVVIESLNDLPLEPNYSKPKDVSYESEPLMPDKQYSPGIYSPIESPLAYAELETLIRNKKRFLYAYGFVEYNDIFNRPQETRFGLLYECGLHMSFDRDRFRLAGPPAYNRYRKPKKKRFWEKMLHPKSNT